MMTMHPPSLLPEDARPSWEETDVSSDDGAAFLAADSLDGAGLATDSLGADDEASDEDEALIGALFPGASFANAVPSPEQASPAEKAAPGPGRERAAKNVTAQVPPVFFMIGCQRSGSNWLRTVSRLLSSCRGASFDEAENDLRRHDCIDLTYDN